MIHLLMMMCAVFSLNHFFKFLYYLVALVVVSQHSHGLAAQAVLVTNGPWIINSTSNDRIRLRCINWYGAHQELYVVGGLELHSVAQLTSLFQASGANCVRLPFSVEMVKYNPVVDKAAVAGIVPSDLCHSTYRALDVMDCVVSHLKMQGILIIFNCHNSHGTWVGAGAVKHEQGLWNLPDFPTEDWIQSMELIVRRYRGGIVGMDLRNEIHDQNGVRITWGENDNIDTDWLAASTVAYDRLYKIDPEILVIVGGLCWNTDIRAMSKKVGPIKAFQNSKLVYSVHIYTFSFWWSGQTIISNRVILLLIGLFFLCLSICLFCLHNKFEFSEPRYQKIGQPSPQTDTYQSSDTFFLRCDHFCILSTPTQVILSTSMLLWGGFFGLAIFYYYTATDAGCSTYANDSIWLITLACILIALTFCFGLLNLIVIKCSGVSLLLAVASALLWLGLLFLAMFFIAVYLSSNHAYLDSLGTWSLNGRSVPVWVGEFGTGNPEEPDFRLLWDFIDSTYNLDFAFWAFNGRKWWNGRWESEGFGLLDDQYSHWRFSDFMHDDMFFNHKETKNQSIKPA